MGTLLASGHLEDREGRERIVLILMFGKCLGCEMDTKFQFESLNSSY
jgi:hypothetical protein